MTLHHPHSCLQKGQTPLHYAAQNDHSQVVTLFLNHKPGVMMQQNAVRKGKLVPQVTQDKWRTMWYCCIVMACNAGNPEFLEFLEIPKILEIF